MGFGLNDIKKSKYLAKEDFLVPKVVKIIGEGWEDMKGKGREEDMKGVLEFEGYQKKLVLNVVNFKMLCTITGGTRSDDFIGHSVVLYADENVTDQQGNLVGGIRVRRPKQKAATPTSFLNKDEEAKLSRARELVEKMKKPKTLEEINEEAELASQAAGDEEDEV